MSLQSLLSSGKCFRIVHGDNKFTVHTICIYLVTCVIGIDPNKEKVENNLTWRLSLNRGDLSLTADLTVYKKKTGGGLPVVAESFCLIKEKQLHFNITFLKTEQNAPMKGKINYKLMILGSNLTTQVQKNRHLIHR